MIERTRDARVWLADAPAASSLLARELLDAGEVACDALRRCADAEPAAWTAPHPLALEAYWRWSTLPPRAPKGSAEQMRGRQRATRVRVDQHDAVLAAMTASVAALRERMEPQVANPSLPENVTPRSLAQEQNAEDQTIGSPAAFAEESVDAPLESTRRPTAIVRENVKPSPMDLMTRFLQGRTPAGALNDALGARKGRP